MRSLKELEVTLSKLKGFQDAQVRQEQYLTPSSIAAEALWKAHFEHLNGKVSVDLGAGTGILGIGALLLGSKRVYFVEQDPSALEICRQNVAQAESEYSGLGEAVFLLQDAREFALPVDTALTNPPFGTRQAHLDVEFLKTAILSSSYVVSFHKTSTVPFLVEKIPKLGAKLVDRLDFKFLLKSTMAHHTRMKKYIDVSCLILIPI
ncbi:MAG: METTL5 family protein [Nanoarchaeota archaeon]|nr:METTL5 family protein [Nanoarchaeota archaeon]